MAHETSPCAPAAPHVRPPLTVDGIAVLPSETSLGKEDVQNLLATLESTDPTHNPVRWAMAHHNESRHRDQHLARIKNMLALLPRRAYPAVSALLAEAVRENQPDLVTLLLPYSDSNEVWQGRMTLRMAAFGHQGVLRALAPYVDLNWADDKGLPVLAHAIDLDRVDVLNTLLGLPNLDLDRRDPQGHTPLMRAIRRDRWLAARCLIKQGADPNIQAADGSTALSMAIRKEAYSLVDEWLNEHDPIPDRPLGTRPLANPPATGTTVPIEPPRLNVLLRTPNGQTLDTLAQELGFSDAVVASLRARRVQQEADLLRSTVSASTPSGHPGRPRL